MTNPTSNFGWQMPTATDLVTDLPADFEVFGQSVDTSMADLKGGTTGQILSKATGTDMDFTWITNDVGDITAVTATTPLTGGGTSGAITVGIQSASTSQSGAVQLSDSTSTTSSTVAATSTAVKSANDNALVRLSPFGYVTGRAYQPSVLSKSTTTYSANVTYYVPIYIRESRSFAQIGIATGSPFVGTASIRLGIYNNSNGAPSTVLVDAGTVSPILSSTSYAITINQSLNVGWYWLAVNTITAATTNSLTSFAAANASFAFDLGLANISSAGSSYIGYTQVINASAGFATAAGPALATTAIAYVALVA